VLSPANIGLPVKISATIQPKLQTSIGFLYDLEPSNNSGARYHFVATYSDKIVYSSLEEPNVLINPKSHIFAKH